MVLYHWIFWYLRTENRGPVPLKLFVWPTEHLLYRTLNTMLFPNLAQWSRTIDISGIHKEKPVVSSHENWLYQWSKIIGPVPMIFVVYVNAV